ncbi:MAG: tetratricopeptide repeat protein [Candidatus Aminicenantales bacterium]
MSPKSEKLKITEAAEKYVKAGKFEEAIDEYEKLLEGSPEDVPINNIIGDLYVQLGQIQRAIKRFQASADHYEKKGLYSQAIAIYKKVHKLDPKELGFLVKLGDLYSHLGFISEAKEEYAKAAERLEREKQLKSLISVYERIIKLDRSDAECRRHLAELYTKNGQIDKAVEELNEIAELKIEKNELKEAEKILGESRKLNEENVRTLSNLIKIFKKQKRQKEAIALLEQTLAKKREHPMVLSLLGNLYFGDQNFKKAEDILVRILSEDERNADARAKLGYIKIREDNLDKAFELYDPLVTALINKNKEEKAIGLLGLILTAKKVHLRSLERLASIYKLRDQKENLEIADRVLLEEYRQRKLKDKMILVLKELVALSPENQEYGQEYRHLRKEFKLPEEGKEKVVFLTSKDKEIIKTNLAKADLFIQQGLPRNARRILENLQLLYPDEPVIQQKISLLGEAPAEVGEAEIPMIVEKIAIQEARKERADGEIHPPEPFFEEEEEGEKISAQEIFAETEIIPLTPTEIKEKKYLDLGKKIQEELDAIEAVFYKQLKEKEGAIEKDLTDIVLEFRRQVEHKIDKRNYDTRYNLGMAFMEQGLIDEAVEEFKLAAKDEERTADCFSLISQCFKQKRNYKEAIRWLEDSLGHVEEKSDQQFAVKYELAALYEEEDRNEEALVLYQEVKAWNAQYRDVSKRMKILEKIT